MNRFCQISFVGLLLISCSSFAIQPTEDWYGGLTGFLSVTPRLHDIPMVDPRTGARGTGTISFDAVGGGPAGELGYRCENFRGEAELLYNINGVKNATVNGFLIQKKDNKTSSGFTVSGETTFAAAFINGYYDFFEEEGELNYVPYLGAGIGYARVVDSLRHYNNNVHILESSSHHNAAIAQGIIGVGYFIDMNTSLNLDYRYMTTQTINVLGHRAKASTLNLTLNYAFGCSNATC